MANNRTWKNVVKDLENGKTLEEATVSVPLAVKRKVRKFKTVQISTKQQQAISRS